MLNNLSYYRYFQALITKIVSTVCMFCVSCIKDKCPLHMTRGEYGVIFRSTYLL